MAADHSALNRVARAVHLLEAERLPGGNWRVTGGVQAHVVDGETGACDCLAYQYGMRPCSHIARVKLALGDADMIAALRDLVPATRPSRSKRPDAGGSADVCKPRVTP